MDAENNTKTTPNTDTLRRLLTSVIKIWEQDSGQQVNLVRIAHKDRGYLEVSIDITRSEKVNETGTECGKCGYTLRPTGKYPGLVYCPNANCQMHTQILVR